MTKCGHYFCEDCALERFRKTPLCAIFKKNTFGAFSIAHKRGCITVWLKNDEHFGKMDADKDFISHKIENLSLFLKEIRLLKSH